MFSLSCSRAETRTRIEYFCFPIDTADIARVLPKHSKFIRLRDNTKFFSLKEKKGRKRCRKYRIFNGISAIGKCN